MFRRFPAGMIIAIAIAAAVTAAEKPVPVPTIYVANDNCPDYTWGLTEAATRRALADLVAAHLDEMTRTDNQRFESRSRYNMAVTQEAICFLEHYPERKEELIRRIREGRLYVSPYFCNTLWGMQSAEGAIRSFYPARRLADEWGFQLDSAHHIELPSLPWGTASILAGCGIRSLTVPYLDYDSTLKGLRCPPLFYLEGPDGSRLRVLLDQWASAKANYTQGRAVLAEEGAPNEWLDHYAALGEAYPLTAILASGTHGDISPKSAAGARVYADQIINFNLRPHRPATIINATFDQFWQAVDEAQARGAKLPALRGCLGHSWELWPVSLARYVAAMRQGERDFLSSETLVALAAAVRPELSESTQDARRRAEWCWTMLADHAWNGTDDANRRLNADLRRDWGEELERRSRELTDAAWTALGGKPETDRLTLFNPLSTPRRELVRIADVLGAPCGVSHQGRPIAVQTVSEGEQTCLYFVSPPIAGFGFCQLGRHEEPVPTNAVLTAGRDALEGPYYRLVPDAVTGGIVSLIHKPTGAELAAADCGRTLGQTIYFEGQERLLTNVSVEPVACGPVLARIRIRGRIDGTEIDVDENVTVYAELDRVDFDFRIRRPVSTGQQRLCHAFPLLGDEAVLRVAAAGAVVRPRPQPDGDLLPGANTGRFAVGEFLSVASEEIVVTVVPWDAYALRLDLGPPMFEALGNDQNHREVSRDQNGETEFRFRYSLRAEPGHSGASAAFGRQPATPLLVSAVPADIGQRLPRVDIDPARAVAICLKPCDEPGRGTVVRLWETAGRTGSMTVGLNGYRAAYVTDLMERDQRRLEIVDGNVSFDLPAHGYVALRLK